MTMGVEFKRSLRVRQQDLAIRDGVGQRERGSGSKRFLPPIAWTNSLKEAGFGEKILAFILDLW